MLAVFDRSVAEPPEALKNPETGSASSSAIKDQSLINYYSSRYQYNLSAKFGSTGIMACSNEDNPLPPRLFNAWNGVFCLFKGHIENIAPLIQKIVPAETEDDFSIVMETYHALKEISSNLAGCLVKEFEGKFAFVVYDSALNSAFAAGDSDGSVPFFWGATSDNDLVFSDDEELVKKACGRSYAPFPKGCLFSSSDGLTSFEFEDKKLKPTPWIDSTGQVCGSTFKIDEDA